MRNAPGCLDVGTGTSRQTGPLRSSTPYRFDQWCDIRPRRMENAGLHKGVGFSVWDIFWHVRQFIFSPPCPIEFVHYLQRAFVEAHAVTPTRVSGRIVDQGAMVDIAKAQRSARMVQQSPTRACSIRTGAVKQDGHSYQGNRFGLEDVPFQRLDSYDAYFEEAVNPWPQSTFVRLTACTSSTGFLIHCGTRSNRWSSTPIWVRG